MPAPALDADPTLGTEPVWESAASVAGAAGPEADLAAEPPIMPEFEPDFGEEPAVAAFAPVATVGLEEPVGLEVPVGLEAIESTPPMSPDPEPVRATAEQWEADDPADPEPDLLDPRPEDEGRGTARRRSRVFTATVVLACAFLVAVAAAVAVRRAAPPGDDRSSGVSIGATRVDRSRFVVFGRHLVGERPDPSGDRRSGLRHHRRQRGPDVADGVPHANER